MNDRPYKPGGIPGLLPYLSVADPEKSMAFYETAFGFQRDGEPMMKDGSIVHAEMKFLDIRIMMGHEGAFGSTAKTPRSCGHVQGIGLYLYCEDVDAMHGRAAGAGCEILMPLETMFWGDRMFQVADPDGYHWSFAQNLANFDPGKIPG